MQDLQIKDVNWLINALKTIPQGSGYGLLKPMTQVNAWDKIQTVHHLKTLPEYFQEVIDDRKKFELRDLSDRDIRVGHFACLWEYTGSEYTDRAVLAAVPYILKNVPEFGLAQSFGILSIEVVAKRGLE